MILGKEGKSFTSLLKLVETELVYHITFCLFFLFKVQIKPALEVHYSVLIAAIVYVLMASHQHKYIDYVQFGFMVRVYG